MLTFFSNLLLAEFWKLWGTMALSTAIGVAALAVWWLVPPLMVETKRIALHVAVGAFAWTFAMGWGAHLRDELCRSQFDQARQKFQEMQARINQLTEANATILSEATREKNDAIDAEVKANEQRLAKAVAGACALDDDDVASGMRQQRGKTTPAGKRKKPPRR